MSEVEILRAALLAAFLACGYESTDQNGEDWGDLLVADPEQVAPELVDGIREARADWLQGMKDVADALNNKSKGAANLAAAEALADAMDFEMALGNHAVVERLAKKREQILARDIQRILASKKAETP